MVGFPPPLLKNVKISAGSNEILLDIAFGQTHFAMTDTKNTEQSFLILLLLLSPLIL
jgi:hypothetical protein